MLKSWSTYVRSVLYKKVSTYTPPYAMRHHTCTGQQNVHRSVNRTLQQQKKFAGSLTNLRMHYHYNVHCYLRSVKCDTSWWGKVIFDWSVSQVSAESSTIQFVDSEAHMVQPYSPFSTDMSILRTVQNALFSTGGYSLPSQQHSDVY